MLFFAGGAAEFAAIKAVDWLFFTGALPDDPVGRFFETVRFAQSVFCGTPEEAARSMQAINQIHRHVETARIGRLITGNEIELLPVVVREPQRAVIGEPAVNSTAAGERETVAELLPQRNLAAIQRSEV